MKSIGKVFYICGLIGILIANSCRKSERGPQIQWEKTYGGEEYDTGSEIQPMSDGGFIIAGYTSSFGMGSLNIYLIKIDANGDTCWTKTYGSSYTEAFSIEKCSDGGYVVAGYIDVFGGDMYVIKIDGDGNSQWSRIYGGDSSECAHSIKQTSDGGYIITGHTKSYGGGKLDVYLVKTNAMGDTMWTRAYGGSGDDFGKSVCETPDGGFIVTGLTNLYGNDDIYLIRTDANGDTLWTKAYGDEYQDIGESVILSKDNGFIITGLAQKPPEHINSELLLKIDANGDTVWVQTYGNGTGYDVKQTDDDGYIIVGDVCEDFPDLDVNLLKTNSQGDMIWEKSIGGNNNDQGFSILQLSDGGYLVVGATSSESTENYDVYIIKTDPDIE